MLATKYFFGLHLYTAIVLASAPKGPWDAFSYAPETRLVRPSSVIKTEGTVKNVIALPSEHTISLSGNGSWITLDFGKEIGGLISMSLNPHNSQSSSLAITFTESSLFISPFTSDDSTHSVASQDYDGALSIPSPLPSGLWTSPKERLRGGFRYLTVVLYGTGDANVSISNVTCAISFSPHINDLRDYSGYFYAKDPVFHDEDFLTKIWYSGAYTAQTNVIAVDEGRWSTAPRSIGWANNATAGIAGPVLVDGAKRDRNIWAGDMGIALPTQLVSTYDLLPAKNSLASLFSSIDPSTGGFPYCGPPLCAVGSNASDTYQAWTLIGLYNYFMYNGDLVLVQNVWENYTKAVQFLENKLQPSGLINVSATPDWSLGTRGGEDSEGNALYFKVLTSSAELASYLNETNLASSWSEKAVALKVAFNNLLWSDELGMYTDNATTSFVPQDGNSLAVLFNLTTPDQANSISNGLTKNWNQIGAVSPESPDTISPFISGFELQAHFISGNDERALDLLRLEWGYMLYTNVSVQSTLLEGYTSNGSLGYRSAIGYNHDFSYTSHSHGWSTGPTSALIFYVLGLQITQPAGQTWAVTPHLSGLSAAEGGFTTSLGWFGVSWETNTRRGIILTISTPPGTQGVVTFPSNVKAIQVDRQAASFEGGKVLMDGGNHTLFASIR